MGRGDFRGVSLCPADEVRVPQTYDGLQVCTFEVSSRAISNRTQLSYLDWGDRAFFSEASDHAIHNPDFIVPGLSGRCRPVAIDGPVIKAERCRLGALSR